MKTRTLTVTMTATDGRPLIDEDVRYTAEKILKSLALVWASGDVAVQVDWDAHHPDCDRADSPGSPFAMLPDCPACMDDALNGRIPGQLTADPKEH